MNTDGDKLRPSYAVRNPGELSQLLPNVLINTKSVQAERVDKEEAKILHAAGVAGTASDLSWQALKYYAAKLPYLDPKGKIARALYEIMTEKAKSSPPPEGASPSFRLFGMKGSLGAYNDPGKLLYLDGHIRMPMVVKQRLLLLRLAKGRPVKAVEAIFGVNSVKKEHVDLSLESHALNPNGKALSSAFEQFKPYACALTVGDINQITGDEERLCLKLKNMPLTICSGLRVKHEYSGELIDMDEGDHLIIKEDKTWTSYLVLGNDRCKMGHAHPIVAGYLEQLIVEATEGSIKDVGALARILCCELSNEDDCFQILSKALDIEASAAKHKLRELRKRLETPEASYGPPAATDSEDRPSDEGVEPHPTRVLPQKERRHLAEQDGEHEDRPESPESARTLGRGGSAGAQQEVDIRHRSSPSIGPQQPVVRANELRAQELCEQFERREGRWPHAVHETQGKSGPGCDIYSFASKLDRDNWSDAPDSIDLVERFIEVKGRSAPGPVELTKNEYSRAKQHTKKYHVYRVVENQDTVTIDILPDPCRFAMQSDSWTVRLVKGEYESHVLAAENLSE